jgi:hypothetical protein
MFFGVAWLAFSISAWLANRALAAALPLSSRWRALYRYWWVCGLLLGVASYFIAFPYTTSERYIVHGFPFPAYAFDASGHDYVGFLTGPFMLINFMCWFFAAHIGFWLSARRSHGQAPRDA